MVLPALWISFYQRKGTHDQWALYLDTPAVTGCHIWRVCGDAFEFTTDHSHGIRCEKLSNFKEKWLVKGSLTNDDVVTTRESANNHPVDNEGEFWDCRVYCFELLGILEEEAVLKRHDEYYNGVRRRLHEKWKAEDGIDVKDSEEEHDNEDNSAQSVGSKASSPGGVGTEPNESSTDGPEQSDSQTEDAAGTKKRTLSHGSGHASRSRDQTSADGCTCDPRETKRQKDE